MEALSVFIPEHNAEFMGLYHEVLTGKLEVRAPLALRRLVGLALVRSILVTRGLVMWKQIQEIMISHHPSGQPYITLSSSDSFVAFPCMSLSHSGEWVGCTLSNDAQPVGFDLEDYNRSVPRPYMDLAHHAFSPTEIDFVKQYGEEGFYRLWTAKEAIAKCQGQGLDRALSFDLGEQFLTIFGSLRNTQGEVEFTLMVPSSNSLYSKSELYMIRQIIPGKNIMVTLCQSQNHPQEV